MTPRPDLRGRLRSSSELGQLILVGSRLKRWGVLGVAFIILTVVIAVASAAGLPFLVAVLVAAAAFAVTGVGMFVGLLSDEDAAIARWWMRTARTEWARWQRLTGDGRRVRTARGMRRWLATAPDTPERAECRALYLLYLDDVPGARFQVGRVPTDDPMTRFEAARLGAMADFEAGGEGDLDPVRAAIGPIDESSDRRLAGWQLALEAARQALVITGDWRRPLLDAVGREPVPGGRWAIARVQLPIAIFSAALISAMTLVIALVAGAPPLL